MTPRIAGALANCAEYDRKSKQIENEGFKNLVKKLNPSFNFLVQNIFCVLLFHNILTTIRLS